MPPIREKGMMQTFVYLKIFLPLQNYKKKKKNFYIKSKKYIAPYPFYFTKKSNLLIWYCQTRGKVTFVSTKEA